MNFAEGNAANNEERFQNWKEHFKNRLGNIPEVTDKLTKEIKANKASN